MKTNMDKFCDKYPVTNDVTYDIILLELIIHMQFKRY